MNKERVLLTFGWCRNTYAIMRNLARHGIDVYVGGPSQKTMCSVSRYCRGSFIYPSPYLYSEEFVKSVIKAAERFETGVYIPVHEEILVAAKHANEFPSWMIIPITNYDNLRSLHDKAAAMRLCESMGVSVPKTFFPASLRDLEEIQEIAQFPVIVKLRYSNGGKGVIRVRRRGELLEAYRALLQLASYPPIIQDFIAGNKYFDVDVLYCHGEEIASCCRREIRHKTKDGGSPTLCASDYRPQLVAEVQKVLSHLKWHGVACCEFVYATDTGQSYLYEINPRYWGTLPLDIDCGVEFPYYHYQMATGQTVAKVEGYATGKVSRWILGDMISFIDRWEGIKNAGSHLKEYLATGSDFYMDLKKDDPLPFVQQSLYYLQKFIKTKSRNPIDEGMIG